MSERTIDDDQMQWVRRLAQLRAQRKVLEAQEKEAAEQVRRIAGGRDLSYSGSIVAWLKEVKTSRIDPALLRERYPEVAADVTVTSVSERLTLADGIA